MLTTFRSCRTASRSLAQSWPIASFSSATERKSFSFHDVPLGSELWLQFEGERVDVRITNGGVQDLSVRMGSECSMTVQKEVLDTITDERTRYVVRLTGAGAGSVGSVARSLFQAEVPPRYFGLTIATGGNVDVAGDIKEADNVSIRTQGGTIKSYASVATQTLSLVSGGGAIRAANVMAHDAIVHADTHVDHLTGEIDHADPNLPEGQAGSVDIGRASCVHLDVMGGDIRIESLIANSAKVRGNIIDVVNANTLDGECMLSLKNGGRLCLGGMDGRMVLDDGGCAAVMEVQLNTNARQIEYRVVELTKISCFKTPELRLLEATGTELNDHEDGVCRVVGGHGNVSVSKRDWMESLIARQKRDDLGRKR